MHVIPTAAWLVLRDIWKDVIICDGKEVPIVGGFRGFRNVPSGSHTIENHGAKLEVDLKPGEVKVFVLKSSLKVSIPKTFKLVRDVLDRGRGPSLQG